MIAPVQAALAFAVRSLTRGALAALVACACLIALAETARADSLVLQIEQGAFDDRAVKRAIVAAGGWHDFIEKSRVPAEGVVLRAAGRDLTLDPSRPDFDAAKKLLADAGYAGGESIQFLLLYEEPLSRLAALVARSLSALGMKAELSSVTPDTLDATIRSTRYVTSQHTIELPYLLLTLEDIEAPQPQRLADLAVERPSVEYDPARRRLTVFARIMNLGAGPSGRHRFAFVDRSRTVTFPTVAIEPLQPREDRLVASTIEIPQAALGQTLVLLAAIDTDKQVKETNERNNQSDAIEFALPKPAPRRPDLVVGQPEVGFDPERRRLTVSVGVGNQGEAPAGSHRVTILDHGRILAGFTIPVDPLKAGEKRTVTGRVEVPDTALGRTLVLQAEIDSEGTVEESDEGNNRSTRVEHGLPAPVRRTPDLTVRSFTATYEPASGELVVSVSVANQGDGPAGAQRLGIQDHSGTVSLPAVPVPTLAPGESQILEGRRAVPETLLGRTLVLQAEVDVEKKVTESNERNNRSDRLTLELPTPEPPPVPEQALADLVVTLLEVSVLEASQSLRTIVTVENRGEAASLASELTLRIAPGDRAETLQVPAIAPGAGWTGTRRVKLSGVVGGATLVVTAIADAPDLVAESDETNNRRQQRTTPVSGRQDPSPTTSWPPAPTWPPNTTALVIAGLATISLFAFVWALRRGRPARRKEPTRDRQVAAPLITYRPRSDRGSQAIERVDDEPEILFEIALRPLRDRGTQSVSRNSAE